MTEAAIGHGVLLQRNDNDSPSGWITVGEVKDMGGPNLSRDVVDATHNQSTNRYREFISGLRDGGEVTAQIAYVPGGGEYTRLKADLESDDSYEYRMLFPATTLYSQTAWRFTAFITGINATVPMADENMLDVTWKITGQPTLESTS